MADPLSISSAAIGFVAFALQVATTAAGFVRDAQGFPDEYTKLSLVTNEFATHVRRLGPSIQKIEEKQAAKGYPRILLIADMFVKIKWRH
jgi:hypothetical protein